MIIDIPSISDPITNSSSEAFVVYDKGNIKSIKELVDSILSLLDSSKTFDDYFEIEMDIDYYRLEDVFERLCDRENNLEEFPELQRFSEIEGYEETNAYLESLPLETIEYYFDYYNSNYSYDNYLYPYEGFSVSAKVDDPVVRKVAKIINAVDQIFDIDCS